jgi:hypothetical protein
MIIERLIGKDLEGSDHGLTGINIQRHKKLRNNQTNK